MTSLSQDIIDENVRTYSKFLVVFNVLYLEKPEEKFLIHVIMC